MTPEQPTARRIERAKPSVRSRGKELELAAQEAASCTRCELYRGATQTVFGDGRAGARIMLVGEQPGDREDLAGEPFVGPAGALLDSVMDSAGIPRKDAYVTNAVKHFKFEQRGKRRIHQRPSTTEVQACHVWLEQELRLVGPHVVVCLGATSLRAVLGRAQTISSVRGQVLDGPDGVPVVATIHPSAVLRARSHADRTKMRDGLTRDMTLAAEVSNASRGSSVTQAT